MSLSLALGTLFSSPSAHASRGGGGLAGLGISRSSPSQPWPPSQHGLWSHRRLRRGAEGDEMRVSICASASGTTTTATTTNGPRAPLGLGDGHRWYWRSHGIIARGKPTPRGNRIVCSARGLDYETLQWISSISCLVLMLAKGTAIHKSFLAPLFALQAPTSVLSWIKGEYGTWTAFLALLVRLFYFIPGELDLPFLAMLLVIVSPRQTMDLRETKIGAIISLVIAGYLLFQHFSRAGSLQKAFDQGSIVATLAVICIIIVPCLLLF